MINVTRERRTAHSANALWNVLSDPTNLPRVLDRIKHVDIGELGAHGIPVKAHFDFGVVFGVKIAEGLFSTHHHHHVSFDAHQPLPIVARWTLKPQPNGTLITAQLRFDLKDFVGPLARMAPMVTVRKDVSDELDEALKRVDIMARMQIPS